MSGPMITRDWTGRIVDGRFALHEWLGGSGTTAVFRTDLPQPVTKRAAIKLIAAEGPRADAYLAGWAKDATLSHPHLTRVFRSGRFHFGSISLVYVVTECADEVLAQILPERALTTDETREMLVPVIDALAYLHEKGFVHGHLKPSNVLVVDDQVKLSGDNVAAGGMRNRFEPAQMYDAPEVMSGVLTSAADVWSLGMMLVETLTQQTPAWDRASSREPALPTTMPRAFADVARDCLRLDPEGRCTLKEIKERLEPSKPIAFPAAKTEQLQAAEVVAGRSRVMEEASELTATASKMRLWPLIAGLAAVVVLFGVLMIRNHSRQEASRMPEQSESATESTSNEEQAKPTRAAASGKGAVLEKSMPKVTQQARRTIHGTVVVSVLAVVDASGRVSSTSFKSEGPSRYFARVAMDAARGWKFEPARNSGRAVKSEWILHFRFRQSGDEVTAVEENP